MLLLARHDVLDLADTLATHGSIWVVSLGRGKVVKRAIGATSSAFEVRLGRTRAVVADHLVDDSGIAQSSASVAHQVRGIFLAIVGKCSEGSQAFTSLAPHPENRQYIPDSDYGRTYFGGRERAFL